MGKPFELYHGYYPAGDKLMRDGVDIPLGRFSHAALEHNGKMVIAAGFDTNDALSDVWFFDYRYMTWQKAKNTLPDTDGPHPAPRRYGSAWAVAHLTGDYYAYGGFDGVALSVDDMWRY